MIHLDLSEKGVFFMYIRKSVLGALTAFAGIVFLAVLSILFCFTEIAIPVLLYAAGWFGCLGLMLLAVSRIYR